MMTTKSPASAAANSPVASFGSLVVALGASGVDLLDFLGGTLVGIGRRVPFRIPQARERLASALRFAGMGSLPIVALMGLTAGLVLTLLGSKELGKIGVETGIPRLVGVVVLREIAVLIVGIALAGRVASSYAAELAAANATGETDALRRSGLDPIHVQVAPRVLALVLAAPLLLAYTNVMAVAGSLLYGATSFPTAREHAAAMLSALSLKHAIAGFLKAIAFGFVAACAGCYHGLHGGGTPAAISAPVRRAVVFAVIGVGLAEVALILAFKWMRL
jgi:phospholipid/cholesterol/gamma-HCH transport system permease protein